MEHTIHEGDCLEALRELADCSIDALLTDPPAGIAFMGTAWDGARGGRDQWIAWLADVMREALRILKPGAHGLVWALPRTSHWTATALEDAGFEIRDRVTHLFGQGFPKGGQVKGHPGFSPTLKPAAEDWWLVRKPFRGSVTKCMNEHGVGALNIDACRIEASDGVDRARPFRTPNKIYGGGAGCSIGASAHNELGRWPAHVTLDEEAARVLDEQSGFTRSTRGYRGANHGSYGSFYGGGRGPSIRGHIDEGGASRFFYVAKASPSERSAGLDGERNGHPTVKPLALMRWLVRLITPPGGVVLDPFAGSGTTGVACVREGRSFVGIEAEAGYVRIGRARIEHARRVSEYG